MDKKLNKTEEQMMLSALEKAKEARRKMEQKEEEKRWAEIKIPLTLADALGRLTKDELSAIRSNLHIYGASSLKKQELTAVLESSIPEALPGLLNKFDESRYRILKQIAGRDGHAFLPLEHHQIDYFKSTGLLFPGTFNGKKLLVMPGEVIEAFKNTDTAEYRETVRRNTEWIKLTLGALFYYGSLGMTELDKLLKTHWSSSFMLGDYFPVIHASQNFYDSARRNDYGFSHRRAWDAERIRKEHISRPDLPYYPFSKKQLLLAGEPNYADRNLSYQALTNYILKHYSMPREQADGLVEECVYAIQNGESLHDLLFFLQSQLEMDDPELMDGFVYHLTLLHNNTRQWFLKGYSPDELSAARKEPGILLPVAKAQVFNMATGNKVGRNDPCPCGSGKKFKKCCGK